MGIDAHTLKEKVLLRQRILEENEAAAARLREAFARAGTLVVNLISSPGSGKTTLLERTVAELGTTLRMAALVGDVATERDAERLRRAGLDARQILTGGACHLDARQIDRALADARFGDLDCLWIENVGNLICPTSFDLGEDFKVALLSVAEGDDKPFKYPGLFARAHATVVTKTDLLGPLEFDLEAVRAQVVSLNPKAQFLALSARTGAGLGDWCAFVRERAAAKGVSRSAEAAPR